MHAGAPPPGIGWSVVQKTALANAKGSCATLALALWDQNQHMDRTQSFRFAPPTQVDAMRQMGLRTELPDEFASPIVATFHNPDDSAFSFQKLFEGMQSRGFIIFPGRLPLADTFRIGCAWAVAEADMAEAMQAVADTLREMEVTRVGEGR